MSNHYQLISPIVSNNIYKTSRMMKGAKKCYEELKSHNIKDLETFSIKNRDTNETLTFKIHKQHGGGNDDKIDKLDERLKLLELKVELLIK